MEELEEHTPERAIEKRTNGSQVFTEPYTEKAIQRLKHLILTFYRQGDRKYYSISVDGETVVAKNSDGRKFDNYLQFLTKQTQLVEVKMYQGYSPNCNKYQFICNRPLAGLPNPPVDVQAQIDKALAEQEVKNELEWLRIELEKKDKKLKKQKKLLEARGIKMEDVKTVIQEGKGIISALGFGMGNGIAGVPPEPESEVEIEFEADESDSLSEEQEIYDNLVQNVGKKGIKKALRVMTIISQNPELEDKLVELLNQKNKQNGQA